MNCLFEMTFGLGDKIVGLTELDGQHGVAISAAKTPGTPGEAATDEAIENGIVIWFPTEAQARAVRRALITPLKK